MSRWLCCIVLFVSCPAWAQTPSGTEAHFSPAPPTRAEEHRLILAMADYTARYVDSLPNFICDQTILQFEAGRKPKKWHQLDSLTTKLVFSKGKEERSLELVNGKPVSPRRHIRTPLTSEGEFGILLREVFDSDTLTQFTWSGWEFTDGRQLAVFNFSIDKSHSTLKLTGDMGSGIAPYRGSVSADPESGEIWKITDYAYDIPPIVQTESIATAITYGRVTIGEHSFLLPVHATVQLNTGESNIRNEMTFDSYRRFESDSKVTFTAVDSHDTSPSGHKFSASPEF